MQCDCEQWTSIQQNKLFHHWLLICLFASNDCKFWLLKAENTLRLIYFSDLSVYTSIFFFFFFHPPSFLSNLCNCTHAPRSASCSSHAQHFTPDSISVLPSSENSPNEILFSFLFVNLVSFFAISEFSKDVIHGTQTEHS